MKLSLLSTALLGLCLSLSGCLTQRTVTEGGRTVEEKYIIKRPVKHLIENVEVE